MTDIKTILLIGRSGRGKSTLANVVADTSEFKESGSSVSETKKIQLGNFKENGVDYQIIDTPGIGDTKMSDNDVLDIIAEAIYRAKDGVSQVFFVIDGRFDQYEMATYDLLRTILFDESITGHTTVVRTRFANFRKPNKCEEDVNSMAKEFQEKKSELEKSLEGKEKELTATELAEIIKACNKVIHVDNPSLEIKSAKEAEIRMRKNKRNKSREILLKHLNENCQGDSYKPDKLKELSDEIADDYFQYLKKKEELQKQLELERLKSKENQAFVSQPSVIQSSGISEKDNQTELVVEKEEVLNENKEKLVVIEVKEAIAQFQDKKKRLEKEIEEKEKKIRQKVLKHIFNNYQVIKQELGGNVFLNSVTGNHDWQAIHSAFIEELVVKWLSQGFSYQQTKEWAVALSDFDPKIDAEFCAWLRDVKELTVEGIKRQSYPQNIDRLRNEYLQQLEKTTEILSKHAEQLEKKNWKEIHPDFTPELQAEWEDYGFKYEETQEWIQAGFKPDDYYTVYEWKNQEFNPQQAKELIELGFTPNNSDIASKWKENSLNPSQTSQWIKAGLKPKQYKFADYLQKNNHSPQSLLENNNLEELKDKYALGTNDWTIIHEDFSDYQKQWKDQDFTYEQTKEWITVGLTAKEAQIATYAKSKGYPVYSVNVEELRKEYNTWKESPPAQEYLDVYYPKEQRKEIAELDIKEKNLTGSLDLNDFVNLEVLDCSYNQLTDVDIINCKQLKKIRCTHNRLASLDLNNLKQLERIYCGLNQLSDLNISNLLELKTLSCSDNYLTSFDYSSLNPSKMTFLNISDNNLPEQDLSVFSRFTNLKALLIGGDNEERFAQNIYNRFYGSLESLKDMTELEKLLVYNTDVSHGLEYLPESIKEFFLSFVEERKSANKIKAIIYDLFANERGEIETEKNEWGNKYIKNFPQKFQAYKQKLQIKPQIEQTLTNEGIVAEQLNQQLAEHNYLTEFANTWQKYLETAQTAEELNIRKEKILTAIETLKLEVISEQQTQILQPTNLPPKK